MTAAVHPALLALLIVLGIAYAGVAFLLFRELIRSLRGKDNL